jgi:hypothetical protein
MISKGCSQKLSRQTGLSGRGLLFNHKDPPIHARKLRELWGALHAGRIRTLSMICIQVAGDCKPEIWGGKLDVAHI